MSLVDLSTTAASNNAAAPTGAPEGSFLLGDVSNTFRELMAVVRSLAASDTIAAAATTDLGSKTYATFLTLTGTATTITGLGTVSAGIYKFVVYNAAHSVTHNATSLILQGGASRTVANGDVSLFVSLGSGNWRELFYSGGAYQPLDADLTAIAALTTTAFGRGMLEYADAATAFAALKQAATETATGVVELATQAEAEAGSASNVVMTPQRTAQAISALSTGIGVGQTWQDMTASRAVDGTSYTNSTGKPIFVSMRCNSTSQVNYSFTVSGVVVGIIKHLASDSVTLAATGIVPNGATYSISPNTGTALNVVWMELR